MSTTAVPTGQNSENSFQTLDAVLSVADRATLRRAVLVIQHARAELTNSPSEAKPSARQSFLSALGYIVGFADGRKLIEQPTVNLGFASLTAPSTPVDPDAAVDQFIQAVEAYLDPTATRATPLGIIIGAAIYAYGSYLSST